MHNPGVKAAVDDPRPAEPTPLDAALIDLGKSVSVLDDHLSRLAVRLRPVSSEQEPGEPPPQLSPTRGSSPAVTRVDDEAQRVSRLAALVERLCLGLEV